ncbi:hypothetical protein [Actinacidiphila yanglinensis]|uniref:hypothetical protein n=1 Tax=Actinacidiphila yanglinensis TaxID=310779 RepID=UPI000CDE57AD|nr:hypothetical protein [Actinacidiphila yanglinensis]
MKSWLLLTSSIASLLAGIATYVIGAWDGHLFDLRAQRTFCTAKPFAGDGGGSFFPPSEKCRWTDGTTTQLVPSFVDPLMAILLVLGVVLLALALVSIFRPSGETEPARPRLS